MGKPERLSIIGTGNIGRAIAVGLASAGRFKPSEIVLTRRKHSALADLAGKGFQTQADNRDAVRRSDTVILAVQPGQLDEVLAEIAGELVPEKHLLISVVSGVLLDDLQRQAGKQLHVVRAMPNTACRRDRR